MFLSDASIKRPIAMSCLIIALTLLGLKAWREMGLELMPRIDAPYITITVSSSCMENVCQTLLEFNMDVDVDIAATDVRERLDLIRADFPADVEDPKILKFDINATPVVHMALTGDVPLDELYDYANNTLRDRLTVISGVADVELIGGAKREVHVLLDRDKLAAKGLTSMEVVTAIQENICNIPSGRVQDAGREYSVKFDAEYKSEAAIGTLEVANMDGQRCTINDVGRVVMTTEELRQKARIDSRPAIYIKIIKKAEGNAVRVVNRVRAAMDTINRELPGGMDLVWIADEGRFIEATVQSAWVNVGQGILLTAAILFFFLYNIRSTLVVVVTMPLTIIIGLFFMEMLGFTLNMSTLIAIGMSVGILVTNSIVVLEAITKRLNQTRHPKEAARLGANEVVVAVLASAGTNMVVLFPIAVIGGKIGMFLQPLAWSMLIMTAVSLFISFTLTPLLCSVMLKPVTAKRKGLLARMEYSFNRSLGRLINGYRAVLSFNERHRWAALGILALTILMLVHAVSRKVGFDLATNPDRGQVYVKLEYPTDYDLAHTIARVSQVEERLKDVPELQHILSSVGKVQGVIGQSTEGIYLAQILMTFSDRDQRSITIDELQEEVRSRLQGYPECIVTVSMPKIIGGQSQDIELEIAGSDLGILDRLALQTQGRTASMTNLLDVDTTVRAGKPELAIIPDRAVLADLDIPAVGLGLSLRTNLEGMDAGTFKRGDRNYDIVVEFEDRPGKDQVGQFLFPAAPGQPMLLTNLGRIERRTTPIQITRKDKRRVSKLFANLAPGVALGTAVDQLSENIRTEGHFPPGYEINFAGIYEVMTEMLVEFREAIITAVILVILTLAAILESFKQPWLILVTLPLALIGVMWSLALTGQSLSIFVMLGIVMMIGIVVNNAILIMDQFNVHMAEGIPRHKAMITAACERFRPIVMITLAAVLGMLPLALGRGIGAEIRNGVGIASVGGILISGVLTLIVMPILYDLLTRRSKKSNSQ